MSLSTSVNFKDYDEKVGAFLKEVQNPSKPLREWAIAYGRRVAEAWGRVTYANLYNGSVTFRGEVTWGSVGPQYTRKTDGVSVPPWGGVKRIWGEIEHYASVIESGKKLLRRAARVYGNVKGKLRPSGKRVKPSSIFGVDSNATRRQFTTNPNLSADRRTVTLATNQEYSEHLNERAPFGFLTQFDRDDFRERMVAYISGAARKV